MLRSFVCLLLWACCFAAQAQSWSIRVNSPANGQVFDAPATIGLTAEAGGDDNVRVTSIRLYQNGAQVAGGSGGEISYTLTNVAAGTYQFHAQATTNYGTGNSSIVTVTVLAPGGHSPTVSMNAPTGPFVEPATVGLSATASDSDGTIANVEFYANGGLIGSDASPPYQFSWSNVATGSYSVTAKATDNSGVATASAPVNVTIGPSEVIGNIDDISFDTANGYRLIGWACSTARDQSIEVDLFAGGAYGTGSFVGRYTADQASEPAVATACQAQGTQYRFLIPLTPAMRQAHSNQKIYMYGLSPVNSGSGLLSSSGVLSFPAPLSLTRKYVYDQHRRLCKVIEPETGATVMDYDAAGNLAWSASGVPAPSTTDCSRTDTATTARKVIRAYDGRGRLNDLIFPDGNGNQHWDYTPDGLPSQIRTWNNEGTTYLDNTYSYNKRRLLVSESMLRPYTWTLGYGYDGNGHLASQTYPTGLSVTYAPNALGQATQVGSNQGTYASGVSYYPNGAIKQFTYGNGIVHTMTQNVRQLPQATQDGGILGFANTYDQNGNTTRIDDTVQGANYNRYLEYDALDRLDRAGSATFGGSTHYIDYAYDGLDNIRSVSHPGVREHTYLYDALNRLTNVKNSVGATVMGLDYDVQGNLSNKNGQVYGFDYGNRLRYVFGKENYRYDAHGRRSEILKDDGSAHVFQYSQSGQYLFSSKVSPTTGQTTHEHVYLAGSVIATIDHDWPSNAITATTYQHTDALGSPVATTDTNGAVVESTNYEPYGSAINKTVDGIGYTGHVMDGATGLTYMQQRYYDPTLGRFLSSDPVTANSRTGGNFNRYRYANNNPYRFTDPDGRYVCTDRKSGDCDNFEKGLGKVREASSSSRLTSEEKRILGAIVSFYGEKGDDRVQVSFKEKGLVQGTAGLSTTGTAIITLVAGKPILEHGRDIVHEGSHGKDDQDRGRPVSTRAERKETEVKAYSAQAHFQKAENFATSMMDGWTPMRGTSDENIERQAEGSVRAACGAEKSGSCGP
ncbi:hypothetical protein ASD78_07455 [Lysobacter sp. Root667]|uniref:RHS repeat domain-containing protein n=1 Tax=Lysobacter sp. Root667 TaxID=1736581 RepID=UPI0006FF1FD8|nr:Ig-like domain-containing protein [Lysobacter sp. Root667]KRA75795.1 hypothetical protein ASD78_07455 [Lysobacter sp. Root667]